MSAIEPSALPESANSLTIEQQGGNLNAWTGPSTAAFDFRSDTITTPTASMLLAIQNTTLFDDGYGEDTTTSSLEVSMAILCNHEAGVFVLSGTMGNQVAIRSHLTQPPYSVLCDHRAHILYLEAGGVAMLSGAIITGVVPANGNYLTLEDIETHAVISDNCHSCPTKVISLENTLRGIITPLSEVRRISQFARKQGIKMHLDGAKLWEAVAAGAGSLSEYGSCFDSVTMCFSKGLGAPIGSIIVGSNSFIKQTRWMRQAIGGTLRQAGVVTAAAKCAVDVNFGHGPSGEGNILYKTHRIAQRIAKFWACLGGEIEHPVNTNMVWLDLKKVGIEPAELREMAKERGLKLTRGRIVAHYQITEEAVVRLEGLLTDIMKRCR